MKQNIFMPIINSPLNNLYVTIDKKFYDTIQFESGVTLYKDTGFHPEESAMLEGLVVSVPRGIQDRYDYHGITMTVQPGDKILMRYDVVFAYKEQPDRDTPIYKNVLLYNNSEYWKVDIQKVFGKILDDRIEMFNGYVYCEPLEEKVRPTGLILLPDSLKTVERNDKMRVKYIGAPLIGQGMLGVRPGDIVYVQPDVAQRYEINLQYFYIIKQSHLLAVDQNMG
jgi:co-chaperonin GroES (HSP10)